jgi:hypothetical protein
MRRFRDRLGTGFSVLGGADGPRVTIFSSGRRGDVYDTTGQEQSDRPELP